jgi:hypothetical protein
MWYHNQVQKKFFYCTVCCRTLYSNCEAQRAYKNLKKMYGIICVTTGNFCVYLQNTQIQTSQTGGQQYSDTSLLVFPDWLFRRLFYHLVVLDGQVEGGPGKVVDVAVGRRQPDEVVVGPEAVEDLAERLLVDVGDVVLPEMVFKVFFFDAPTNKLQPLLRFDPSLTFASETRPYLS